MGIPIIPQKEPVDIRAGLLYCSIGQVGRNMMTTFSQTQLHIGANLNGIIRHFEIEADSLLNKPRGAFWTSSYIGSQAGSQWVQWCLAEDYRVPDDKKLQGWLLDITTGARLYTIRMHGDLDLLHHKYPADPNKFGDIAIDWTKVADDYDGVHVIQDAVWACRQAYRPGGLDLYSWDCESTAWFNRLALTNARDTGRVTYEYTPYGDEDDE